MSLFKNPDRPAFLKMGIYGDAGTGKTFTSSLIAIGIVKATQSKKPVYFFDTEGGSDYITPLFEKNGVEFRVLKTRAFSDLVPALAEAEGHASVIVIDSLTHLWTELQDSWKKKLNRKSLRMHDWMQIKPEWNNFTQRYLNSQLHIIACGQMKAITETIADAETGYQVLNKGSRMATEKNMSYEPSLLIELERVLAPNGKSWIHRAWIVKDRSDRMKGTHVDNPTFDSFKPFWEYLNLGGKHQAFDESRDSVDSINDTDNSIDERVRRRAIAIEEIQGIMTQQIPGAAAVDKKAKMDVLEAVFGTRSWKKISEDWDAVPLEKLEASITLVEKACKKYGKQAPK